MRVVRDFSAAINALYAEKVLFSREYNEEAFDATWQNVRDSLRMRLRKSWSESTAGDADFAISDDRSATWSQCGAIYSAAAMTKRFPVAVAEVLSASVNPDRWGFHCVIEPWMADVKAPVGVGGEFVVKGGVLYVPKDDAFDYTSILR